LFPEVADAADRSPAGGLHSGTGRQTLASSLLQGEPRVSIVRVGLAETKNFAEGYDAIFGGKKAGDKKEAPKKVKDKKAAKAAKSAKSAKPAKSGAKAKKKTGKKKK
jgi:hypothetical protein